MSGPTSDDLTGLVEAVAREPRRWEFFALVRAFEQARGDRPRVGTAQSPEQESVALAHHASTDFPRTTVVAFETGRSRPTIRSAFMGLTGPMGPLPLHLTEVAIFERGGRGPTPFGDFLDLLSARMLQAFYRAWANAQPCVQADRPHDDRFAAMLGAASGAVDLRFVTAVERPPKKDEGFDDWRRLTYAGHFAALRSASAVADFLTHLIGRKVIVEENVARWQRIPRDERSRIGKAAPATAQLGRGATLGSRFFAAEWNVTLRIRVETMDELLALVPGRELYCLFAEAAGSILPAHLDWEARVEIDEPAIEPARLGSARLGYTSWISPKGRRLSRSDLRIVGAHRQAA